MEPIKAGKENQLTLTDFSLQDTDICCTVSMPDGKTYRGEIINQNPHQPDETGYFVRIGRINGFAKLAEIPPIYYISREIPGLPAFIEKISEREFFGYEDLYEPYTPVAYSRNENSSVYLETISAAFLNRWANAVRVMVRDTVRNDTTTFDGLYIRQTFCTKGFVLSEIHLHRSEYITNGVLIDGYELFSQGTIGIGVGGDFDTHSSPVLYLRVPLSAIAGKENIDNLSTLLK